MMAIRANCRILIDEIRIHSSYVLNLLFVNYYNVEWCISGTIFTEFLFVCCCCCFSSFCFLFLLLLLVLFLLYKL